MDVSIPPGFVVKLVPISNWYNPVGTADVGLDEPGLPGEIVPELSPLIADRIMIITVNNNLNNKFYILPAVIAPRCAP